MSFLSRKKAPEELPDLVIDELKEKLKEKENKPAEVKDALIEKKEEVSENAEIKTEKVIDKEKSFFNKILIDINSEVNDLGKLEDWYNNKFIKKDIVEDMKNYWEDKKHELVLKSLGQGFKDKINEKIIHLQNLEADWQDIYLKLIQKEDELKKEEKELKKIISEFMGMCKRRDEVDESK